MSIELLNNEFDRRFIRPDEEIDARMPNFPLSIRLGDATGAVSIPEDEWQLMMACAKWEVPPPFVRPNPKDPTTGGRSAAAIRHEDLYTEDDPPRLVRSYKMKGVGVCDENGVAYPPREERYDRQHIRGEEGKSDPFLDHMNKQYVLIHMGINPDGSFHPVVDPPRPTGGMKASRGKAEFDNAAILLKHDVPAVMPVRYGDYPELTWEGEPMGFVFLALPHRDVGRVGRYFEPQRDERGNLRRPNAELVELVQQRFDIMDPSNLSGPMMRFIREVEEKSGACLRGFTDAGLARFAGHTGNFSYCVDAREVFLHDLDSSVKLDSLDPETRGLTIIRDIESALFGLFHSITHSEIYKFCDEETFARNNPFAAFLRGYFRSNDRAVQDLGQRILEYVFNEVKRMPQHGDTMRYMSWMSDITSRLPFDLIEMLMPLFKQSELGEKYSLPYGPGAVYRDHVKQYKHDWEQAHIAELQRRGVQPGFNPLHFMAGFKERMRGV